MTTPAVNTNVITQAPTQFCFRSGTNPFVCSYFGDIPVAWEKKLRPASSTQMFDSKRFRACKAWSHSGHRWNRSQETVKRLNTSNLGTTTEHQYRGGNFWSVNPPSMPAFPSGLVNRAEQKALLKLHTHDFNLGIVLAEIQQTANLVGDSAARIAKLVKYYRLTNAEAWRRVRKWEVGGCLKKNWHEIPSSWLELQYGWIPMMSDILAALGYIQDSMRKLGATAHVFSKQETHDVLKIPAAALSGGSTCTLEYLVKHKAHVSLYFEVANVTLTELSGLGLVNPGSIIWERLMYSFVVDWFLPVGPWLQSLTAATGFTFKSGSRSTISQIENRGMSNNHFASYDPPGPISDVWSGEFPSMRGSAFSFVRTCYDSTPVPGVYLKNPLSMKHMLNGLALLSLAFRR